MESIANAFKKLKEVGKTAFIPFSLAGYPNHERSLEVFLKLAQFGDVVEFGFPFSDPIADGPVIQLAAGEAIRNGITMDGAFEMIGEIRRHSDTPIVFFSYFNPIHKYGTKRFAERARESGVNGGTHCGRAAGGVELAETCYRCGRPCMDQSGYSNDSQTANRPNEQ